MPNSAWTATGSAISLVPVTTPIDASLATNVNYLTNSDKITLMAQYAAELATKTALDTMAAGLSVSSTAYDNAVAAISTGLITAGAPSNWATTWPDGTVSGPWVAIQTYLGNWWAAVATQRSALQMAISAAQAAAAQAAAVAVATVLAPVVVSTLPTLPNSSYPSGRYAWNTTDGQLYLSTGSAWTVAQVNGANITAGTITAGQLAAGSVEASQLAVGAVTAGAIAAGAITGDMITAGSLTANVIYFSDGFCLNTLEPAEAGANNTLSHIDVSNVTYTGGSGSVASSSWVALAGLSWTVVIASTSDVLDIVASLTSIASASTTSVALFLKVCVVVDGDTSSPVGYLYFSLGKLPVSGYLQYSNLGYLKSITGLSAGSHTIQLYAMGNGSPQELDTPSCATLKHFH